MRDLIASLIWACLTGKAQGLIIQGNRVTHIKAMMSFKQKQIPTIWRHQ